MWSSSLRSSPSPISYGPTISRTPSDLNLDCSAGVNKGSRRRNREAQEILRIMDPSFLSPHPPTAGRYPIRRYSGDYYIDAQGHLHDIDYQLFPPIRCHRDLSPNGSDSNNGESSGERCSRPSPRRSHTSPNPRPPSPQVPYWETFTFPQQDCLDMVGEDPFRAVRTPTPERQAYVNAYADYANAYSIHGSNPGGHVEPEKRERRVLTKSTSKDASKVKGDGSSGVDGDQEDPLVESNESRRIAMSPKQKLQQTWVATSFDLRLKMIRTQRWLRERVQGQ